MRLESVEKTDSRVLEFAKSWGFNFVNYAGKWKGYDAYAPLYDKEGEETTGPVMILAKAEEIRWTTPSEGKSIFFGGDWPAK